MVNGLLKREVPIVKECEIKAHVTGCEPFITTNEGEEGVDVPYIVHGYGLWVMSYG
jgi:hypothetical protein